MFYKNYGKHSDHKYCSISCYSKSRIGFHPDGTKIKTRICMNCSNIIEYKKSCWQNNNHSKFCSKQCFYIYKKGRILSSGEKIKQKKCLWCKKYIKIKDMSFSTYAKLRFCSYACANAHKRDVTDKKHGSRFCKYCKEKIILSESNRNRFSGMVYCSVRCRGLWHRGKTLKQRYGIKKANEYIVGMSRPYKEKYSKEVGNKILSRISGKNNWNYVDGLRKYPYPSSYSYRLRNDVKKRDNFICKSCGSILEDDINTQCHHIHYDCSDNRPEFIVTVCRKCNLIANTDRDYWFAFFCYKLGQEPEGVFL